MGLVPAGLGDSPLPMTLRLHSTFLQPEVEEAVKERAPAPLIRSLLSGSLPVYGCDNVVYQGSDRLQDFCKAFHSGGLLSFQEFVSMLPVIALDIQPGDRVLDMCSAPGSKTVQVLDQVRAQAPLCQDSLIVANEKDYVKASHTLPSRLKRYYTPNVVITRSDAAAFPRLVVKGTDLKFDKVVCDVPCSGDGTLRKDRGLLSSWNEEYVSKLAAVQQSILRRGFQSLVPGGVLAYSTCSMNPREDEESILSLLSSTTEAELLNVNEVLSSHNVHLSSKGGARRRDDDSPLAKLVAESVLRVFPHSDDTGGFFVALIRKKLDASEPPPAVSKLSNWAGSKRLQLLPISSDADADSIGEFFGCALLSDAHAAGLRVVKHFSPTGKVNRLFLLSHSASTLVFDAQLHKSSGVEIISAGSRVFERLDDGFLSDCPCRWRVATESAEWLASVATKRKLLTSRLSRDTVLSLLKIQAAARADLSLVYPELVDLASGPILLGLDVGAKTVWLPGILHPSKLELTVDISYRKCLLFLFFGVETEFSDSKSIST